MTRRFFLICLLGGPLTAPLLACATCFGRSDSALAEGMNMGILFLLGVIGVVLAGIAGFMIFLARRAAQLRRPTS